MTSCRDGRREFEGGNCCALVTHSLRLVGFTSVLWQPECFSAAHIPRPMALSSGGLRRWQDAGVVENLDDTLHALAGAQEAREQELE